MCLTALIYCLCVDLARTWQACHTEYGKIILQALGMGTKRQASNVTLPLASWWLNFYMNEGFRVGGTDDSLPSAGSFPVGLWPICRLVVCKEGCLHILGSNPNGAGPTVDWVSSFSNHPRRQKPPKPSQSWASHYPPTYLVSG